MKKTTLCIVCLLLPLFLSPLIGGGPDSEKISVLLVKIKQARMAYLPLKRALLGKKSTGAICYYLGKYEESLNSLYNDPDGELVIEYYDTINSVDRELIQIRLYTLSLQTFCGIYNTYPRTWNFPRIRYGNRTQLWRSIKALHYHLKRLKYLLRKKQKELSSDE